MSATIVFDELEGREVLDVPAAPEPAESQEVIDGEIIFEPFEEQEAVPALHKHNAMLSNPVVWGELA